ncbi:MAG: 2-oxo acid dehydrogenase subunit E2 [Chloroflexi bacterium]|nr:2-oxo acid dehydrogenase subunit E2 [Chloroflexota bacterium]
MAEELFIPKFGQTVEEVTLLNWLVKDGDKVEQGQEVLEVETDKAVFNVEAVDKGYIHLGPFISGDVVPVLAVVAVIGRQDEKFEVKTSLPVEETELQKPQVSQTLHSAVKSKPSEPTQSDHVFISPRARKLASEKNVNLKQIAPTGGKGMRIREQDVINFLSSAPRVNPLARTIAHQAGLDLRSVTPSGPRGEITRADVEMALAVRTQDKGIVPAVKSNIPLPDLRIKTHIPLKGVRGLIAERMGMSARSTSRVTMWMDVGATALVELREKLKSNFENVWGFAPGYNDLLARSCAIALSQYPFMNARLNAESIEQIDEINIGIAVDAEKGLYVPVIRDANHKDLQTIGIEFRQRVEEIRSGSISPDHLSGGTFTITNLGMYDIEGFTPVINLPEAAILGVGKIIAKPVVRDDQITIQQMMTLSLAFDHRLVDGAPAARFMQAIKNLIESPDEKQLLG